MTEQPRPRGGPVTQTHDRHGTGRSASASRCPHRPQDADGRAARAGAGSGAGTGRRQRLLRRLRGRPRRRPDDRPQRDHRDDRPVRLRQVHRPALAQPDERPDPRRPGHGHDHLPRPGPVRQGGRPDRGPPPHRHGVPEAEPVPEVDLRQHRVRPAGHRHEGRQHGRPGRAGAARRGAVGRGEGQAQGLRAGAVRRPAAAAVHRAHDRGPARGDPHGRAVLGARPDRHRRRSKT